MSFVAEFVVIERKTGIDRRAGYLAREMFLLRDSFYFSRRIEAAEEPPPPQRVFEKSDD